MAGKAFIVVTMGALLLLARHFAPGASQTRIFELHGATMGTQWQVQIASLSPPPPHVTAQLNSLLARLDREVFSTYSHDSELSRFNRSPPGEPVTLSPELQQVLADAVAIYGQSLGAFDITVAPLVDLWGFGPAPAGEIPTATAIVQALSLTGIDKLVLDEGRGTATRRSAIRLDLSGIAKGFAVDATARLLREAGYEDFLIEIGGEILVQGLKADMTPWQIAVETPDTGPRSPYRVLSSGGQALAMAGSGNYRNFRQVDGIRYSHEIDPRTGYPVSHNLAAVTVLADNTTEADAWATALMVLGPEKGLAVANRYGLAVYFITLEDHGFSALSSNTFQQQFGR